MRHAIQTIFTWPRWRNRRVVSLCEALDPRTVRAIRRTKDDVHAMKLLDDLVGKINESNFPGQVRVECITRLFFIADLQRRSYGDSISA